MPPQEIPPQGIQWNKVTWYSQLAALVIGVAIFFLGFYVGQSQAPLMVTSEQVVTETPAQSDALTEAPEMPIQSDASGEGRAEGRTDTYTTHDVIEGWQTYQGPQDTYPVVFQYPADWKVDDSSTSERFQVSVGQDKESRNPADVYSNIGVSEGITGSCFFGKPMLVGGEDALVTEWGGNLNGEEKTICLHTRTGQQYSISLLARTPEDKEVLNKIFSTLHF